MTRESWSVGARALPRPLHPGAWWLWALGLAAAAGRTNNPLLLLLIIAVAALVVAARRPAAPWARSFGFFVRLGILVIAVRVLVQVVFGAALGSTLVLPLPGIVLPEWMAGVRLGGDVMLESVLLALFDGLRLATILICIGAANSLASPSRLLKSLPAALYEIGVSVVVALTFTPQLVTDVTRVQSARRLRGRPTRGVKAIAGAAMPVLEGALEHSVALAAAMDSRGYGRRAGIPAATRRMSASLLVIGLIAACVGVYALVAADTSAVVGLLLLVAGSIACIVALALSARGNVRSRYRPDPWWLPEWLVSASGLIAALAFTASAWAWPGSLTVITDPPTWPGLPLIPLLAVVLAASPILTAPQLPVLRAPSVHLPRETVPA